MENLAYQIKIDFGRPNAEIGQKMANGRLLFLQFSTATAVTHVQL